MLTNQSFVSKAVTVQLARKKMSQASLAKTVGVSPNYMSRMLNGKATMNLTVADKIGAALGVTDIFGLIALAETERDAGHCLSTAEEQRLEKVA